MKKTLSKLCIVLLLCCLAAGCAKTKAGGALTAYEGGKPIVGIGMSQTDVRKVLGEPTQAMENIDTYDGLEVSYYDKQVYSVKIIGEKYTDMTGHTVGNAMQTIRDEISQAQAEYQCLSVYYDDDMQPMGQFENSHYAISYWESESDPSQIGFITIFNMKAATAGQ